MKVLISPGYGAGWSTWNDPNIAFDERIIKAFIDGISSEEMKELCEECGYENTYMGGFRDLILKEVPSGVYFRINEYDGYESLEILDLDDWYFSEGEFYDCH